MASSVASSVISLGALLRGGETFTVPPFQRNYAWTEEQFGQFWQDMSRVFDGAAAEYLLGSIVLDTGRTPDLLVIDGQQRLITTAVLVAALRNLLRAGNEPVLAAQVERELLARREHRHGRALPSLVLNRSDQTFFDSQIFAARPLAETLRHAEDDALPQSNRLIAACSVFMQRRLAESAAGQPLASFANGIVEALTERVHVIRIDVSDDYNAFQLFETLNDRGLELSEADLLKNHLFGVAGAQLFAVQSDWETMEQNLGAERVVRFIRHFWLSTRGGIGERGLYADIKSELRRPETAQVFAAQACAASDRYAALSQPRHHVWAGFAHNEQPGIAEAVNTLGILRPEQVNIMLLAGLETDPARFPQLLRHSVAFTFRYTTICNLSPAAALTAYIGAARDIRTAGRIDMAALHTRHFAARLPDDAQFQSAFARKTVRSHALARYILATINDHLSPQASLRTQSDAHATDLEHILPRAAGPRHERFINSLGNMTLLAARLNNRLGDADFAAKKSAYARDCLAITRPLLDCAEWSVDEIKRRQNWFAGLAVSIWRCPPRDALIRAE